MKKFSFCKLCLIVFGALLAVQSAFALDGLFSCVVEKQPVLFAFDDIKLIRDDRSNIEYKFRGSIGTEQLLFATVIPVENLAERVEKYGATVGSVSNWAYLYLGNHHSEAIVPRITKFSSKFQKLIDEYTVPVYPEPVDKSELLLIHALACHHALLKQNSDDAVQRVEKWFSKIGLNKFGQEFKQTCSSVETNQLDDLKSTFASKNFQRAQAMFGSEKLLVIDLRLKKIWEAYTFSSNPVTYACKALKLNISNDSSSEKTNPKQNPDGF